VSLPRALNARLRQESITAALAFWCLLALCLAMAAAAGGGLYEHAVLTRSWGSSVWAETGGASLRRFWIPVHGAIAFFGTAALMLSWHQPAVRNRMLIGLVAYTLVRAWSGLYLIPERMELEKLSLDSIATEAIHERLLAWQFWSGFREPIAFIALLCFLQAAALLRRN
jgi:hypothetical protein